MKNVIKLFTIAAILLAFTLPGEASKKQKSPKLGSKHSWSKLCLPPPKQTCHLPKSCHPKDQCCTLPTNSICFYSTNGFYESYLDIKLENVPVGYSVSSGVYGGWCFQESLGFTPGYLFCDAIARFSTDPNLPSHLGESWGIINYILNHKLGTRIDVQNAIWHFSDGYEPPAEEQTAAYLAMIQDAAGQSGFVPGPGEVIAVILDLGANTGIQGVCIEVVCKPCNPGTGTPGYWKNHPEAWPVAAIKLGNQTYTKWQAILIMQLPTKRDKTLNLAEHLIAAKLNVLIGNDSSCIADAIANADAFLAAYPVGSGVSASSTAWQTLGAPLLQQLADYNEGKLCAPARG